MIPQGGASEEQITQTQQPSKTYGIDFSTGRFVGMIDGFDAMKQAVFKILNTERFAHVFYNQNYGIESLAIGSSPSLVTSNFSKSISEALLRDDRILEVRDIQVNVTGDEALATFTVVTQFGSFQTSQGGVKYDNQWFG